MQEASSCGLQVWDEAFDTKVGHKHHRQDLDNFILPGGRGCNGTVTTAKRGEDRGVYKFHPMFDAVKHCRIEVLPVWRS